MKGRWYVSQNAVWWWTLACVSKGSVMEGRHMAPWTLVPGTMLRQPHLALFSFPGPLGLEA